MNQWRSVLLPFLLPDAMNKWKVYCSLGSFPSPMCFRVISVVGRVHPMTLGWTRSSKSELHPMTLTLWQSPPLREWLELVNMKRSLMIMLPSMAERRLSRWTWIRKQIFSRVKIEVKKIPEVRGICWATAGFEDEGNIWDGLQVASQSRERPSSWQPEPSWELQTVYKELDLPTN